jgi:hypothetical protein
MNATSDLTREPALRASDPDLEVDDARFQYEPALDPSTRARPVPAALLFALLVTAAACAGVAVF